MKSITPRQVELIEKLVKQSKIPVNIEEIQTYEQADVLIKEMLVKVNGVVPTTSDKKFEVEYLDKYPIAFQAFVKSACDLYKHRNRKTFKDVVKEVKEVY